MSRRTERPITREWRARRFFNVVRRVAGCPGEQPVAQVRLHSTADASHPAALLVAQIIPDILAPRALPGGRLDGLGAAPDLCHGLLVARSFSEMTGAVALRLEVTLVVSVRRRDER